MECGSLPVLRRPEVAILSTGDEVLPLASTPESRQMRTSNAYWLTANGRRYAPTCCCPHSRKPALTRLIGVRLDSEGSAATGRRNSSRVSADVQAFAHSDGCMGAAEDREDRAGDDMMELLPLGPGSAISTNPQRRP